MVSHSIFLFGATHSGAFVGLTRQCCRAQVRDSAPANPLASGARSTGDHGVATAPQGRSTPRPPARPQCLVISLLYIERLCSTANMVLLKSNWQPILLSALVVAQKVWDDRCLSNADFSVIAASYSLRDVNELERQFLETLRCPSEPRPARARARARRVGG